MVDGTEQSHRPIRAKRSLSGGWGGGGGTSGEPLKRERTICVKNGAIIRNTSFVVTYVTNDTLIAR